MAPSNDVSSPKPMWKGFVEGSVAAMVGGGSAHPLDVLKVRMQIQGEGAAGPKLSPVGMVKHMVKTEGISGLYGGLTASLLRQCVYSGSRLGVYDAIKTKLTGGDSTKNLPFYEKVGAGMFSGALGSAIANPCDVSMVRMQADGKLPIDQRRNYKNVFDAISRITREEGVANLWRGVNATVLRGVLVTVGQVSCYDASKEFYIKTFNFNPDAITTHFSGAISAAFVAAVLSNPADVAKTRMMNMKADAKGVNPYNGLVDCILKTAKAEGPMALYKGFGPTFTRQCPFLIVTWITLEQMKRLLKDF